MIPNGYTEEEMNLLSALPQTIGSAMAFAGSSGLFGTGKEMFASAAGVMEGLKAHPNNTLINAIVPNPQAADRGAEIDRMKKVRDWTVARMKTAGIDSAEKFTAAAVEDAKAANALLAKATPQEAAEYRQWVMQVAEKVANASTEGGFLGFGGERLSQGERDLLGQLQGALGVATA